MINIKLDKTGALTEVLAMAPPFVVAPLCDFVDLDGPLSPERDRPGGLKYNAGQVEVLDWALWG